MLEEILALFLPLFSLVSSETPRVSFRETSNTKGESPDNDRWLQYINEEYKTVNFSEELTSASLLLANEDLHPGYNLITDGSLSERKSALKSFQKAIWTSISMALSLFLLTAFTIMFLYVD